MSIIRVRSIKAVVTIVNGILRHLPLGIVSSVKEGSCGVWRIDDILESGRKAEPYLTKAGVAVCYTSVAH